MQIINRTVLFILIAFSQPVWSQSDQTLPDGIMAIRGEGVLSREQFDARLSRIPVEDRKSVLLSAERVKSMMADMLLTSQLKAEAQAVGFDQGEMQARMQLAADRELINAWLEHYVDTQPPADYEALAYEYYLVNKDKIRTAPSLDLTHLLVSNEQSSDEEALAQAQIYLDQITADPSVFDQLVMDHSEDPSARSNKGHFKGVKKGDMVPEFEEAAFALESPGDLSGLVQTLYGVHIIRLDKINPSRIMSFDEVKGQLIDREEKEHKKRIRYTYLNNLSGMEWQVSAEALETLVEDYSDDDVPQNSSGEPDSE